MNEQHNPDAPAGGNFYLRTPGNRVFALAPGRDFQTLSFEWAYRIRNRQMWITSRSSRAEIAGKARQDLIALGIPRSALDFLADQPLLEVNIPFDQESIGWELRTMPWEYLLSLAIYRGENDPHPLVLRRLERAGKPRVGGGRKFLFVISAPGRFGELFQFEGERKLIEASLQTAADTVEFQVMESPTLEELKARIAAYQPDVVHLTGVDSHEGADILKMKQDPHRRDGFFLGDDRRQPVVVDSQELAAALNCDARSPALVTCNTYHSAARTCALAVAQGAELGLGFQDTVDNAQAELFLSSFYRAWKMSDFCALSAFQLAFEEMEKGESRDIGGGVVLWSAHSLLEKTGQADQERIRNVQEVKRSLNFEKQARFDQGADTGGGALEKLMVNVKVKRNLNYALLHNNQDLFEVFRIHKYTPACIPDINVEVMLQVGSDRFQYRHLFDMTEPVEDLAGIIRVPLTWEFARALQESIFTNLYYEISYQGEVVSRKTEQIRLLPSDEWLDTRRDGKWLPSFVFPRDREVRRIVDKAQNYLKAINDDPVAGFDGYQSGDPVVIDCEAQAIWSALLYDYGLSYIDPPPTYTEASQRLRTPGQVVEGRRGTCIDLALLYAACLEYVGLYPVIFLLRGHAFPGYWRTLDHHSRFVQLRGGLAAPTGGGEVSSAALTQLSTDSVWLIEPGGYDQLMSLLDNGEVVPVETVCLTSQDSFAAAREAATGALRERDRFDAMLDIRLARKHQVTPLPLPMNGGT